MNEILKPIYEKVEKILKGEYVGTISVGVSDVFNQVSKEFIGYNCFGEVIWSALYDNLEGCIGRLRTNSFLKSEEMFVSQGDILSDSDVAYELSEQLFPPVLSLVHDKDDHVSRVIDSMYAFIPCDEYIMNNVFETLGETFKNAYTQMHGETIPKTTEKLYKNIISIMPF